MIRIKATLKSKVLRRVAPIVCVMALGVGAAACGSGGGPDGHQTGTTQSKSGGAGF